MLEFRWEQQTAAPSYALIVELSVLHVMLRVQEMWAEAEQVFDVLKLVRAFSLKKAAVVL